MVAVWLLALSLTTTCSHRSVYLREPPAPWVDTDAAGELSYRLLLIGDAGHAEPGSPVIAALAQRAAQAPQRTSVVFLGDNVYPAGLVPPSHAERADSERHLLAQIDPLRELGAELLFVPGNHDWDNAGPDALGALQRQQRFVVEHGGERARMAPAPGEPGPECIDRVGLRLVVLDSQWWLHSYAGGSAVTQNEVLERLSSCLRSAAGRHVVVVAHHPLHTNGLHGGFASTSDHIFPLLRLRDWGYLPLPIVGSLYPLVRSLGVSSQDLNHERNQAMVAALTTAMRDNRPLLFAAGHDHSLQVHQTESGPRFHAVSGAGSDTSPVSHDATTLFAVERLGFMELDVDRLGVARLRVYDARQAKPQPLWERRLGRFGG